MLMNGISRRSIRTRFLAVLTALTIIPILIILLFSKWIVIDAIINKYYNEYLENLSNTAETNINAILYQVNMMSLLISSDKTITKAIEDTNKTVDERGDIIRNELRSMISGIDVISELVIEDNDGTLYRYAPEEMMIEPPGIRLRNKVTSLNIIMDDRIRTDINNNIYLVIARRINSLTTNHDSGYIYIYIDRRVIYDMYADLEIEGGYSFITADNFVVTHRDINMVGSQMFMTDQPDMPDDGFMVSGTGDYIIANYRLKNISLPMDWNIVSVIPYDNMYSMVKSLNTYVIIILICGLLLAVILSVLLSNLLLRPVMALNGKMRDFVEGRRTIGSGDNKNELYLLENSYDKLILRIDDLMQKIIEEKEKQRIADLRALQAQINPHFVYNTLDAICWMAKIERQTEIEEAVHAMASFFRISLHKGDIMITVAEEIEHVKSYVAIEQIRMAGRISVNYDIEEGLMNKKIVKIILQPIVENSIKHGFSRLKRMGTVNITGRSEDGYIVFTVSDNGHGIDAVEKDGLPMANKEKKYGGYGLSNIRERLMLEYKQDCSIDIKSEKEVGTTVVVRVKMID